MRGFVVLLAALSAVHATDVLQKRQATRSSILGQLWMKRYASPVGPRTPEESSPGDPTCLCDGGPLSGLPCPDDCSANCPPDGDRKRSLLDEESASLRKRYPRSRSFIPLEHYDGLTLPPQQMAEFLLSQGTRFSHPTNGSTNLRDEGWIDLTVRARIGAERSFSVSSAVKRAVDVLGSSGVFVRYGSKFLVRYFSRQLATNEVEGHPPHELVFRLSDDFGMKATDLVPLVRYLLSDPHLRELTAAHYVITREMIQHIEKALCPQLGPEMCGFEIESEYDNNVSD